MLNIMRTVISFRAPISRGIGLLLEADSRPVKKAFHSRTHMWRVRRNEDVSDTVQTPAENGGRYSKTLFPLPH
ncbi:hypothetical protein DNTS_028389, partial [Danionella cerebrum]